MPVVNGHIGMSVHVCTSSRVEVLHLILWHIMCVSWVVGSGILGLVGLVRTDTAAA